MRMYCGGLEDDSQDRYSRKPAAVLGAEPMGSTVRDEGLCGTQS